MLETLQYSVRESIDESPRPTWNAASIRAALMRATEARLRRGRLNADSDILQINDEISLNGDSILVGVKTYEDRSCSCIAADNRRRHRQTGAVDVLPHVPPRVVHLP
jgi:hypothetical protein